MKIKSLLIGMLACTALVGCSDDDVLNNAEQENQQAEKIDAYLKFSIASSTNSSRADNGNEGTTTGDSHQKPEHSGHENIGTANENKINEVLVLFYNSENTGDGFANIYELNGNGSSESPAKYHDVDVNLQLNSDGTLTPSTPFKLQSIGKYYALIVLNPCDGIKTLYSSTITTQSGAKTLYENILKGKYEATDGSASGIISRSEGGTATYDNFMMANQKAIEINVSEANNTPEKAATTTTDDGIIYVERVASKITFRPSEALTSETASSMNAANTYKYTAENMHTEYTINTHDGWEWTAGYDTEDTDDDTYTYKGVFMQATTNESAVAKRTAIWVLKEAKGDGTYEYSYYTEAGTYKGYNTELSDKAGYKDGWYETKRMKPYIFNGTPIYQGTANESSKEEITYYVQLKRYALVNLNNAVYYTRHTSGGNVIVENPVNWGTVTLGNYLQEPYSYNKSNATSSTPEAGVVTWTYNSETTADWFGNTALNAVISKIKSGAEGAMKELPGSIPEDEYDESKGEDQVTDAVTEDNESGAQPTNPESGTVGTCLAYCLENVVASNMQNKHLTTGIIFEAQIYDETGTAIPVMYQYRESFYKDLKALNDVVKNDAGEAMFGEFLDENNTTGQLDSKLKDRGVITYRDGKCYYFSSQIKHYADDNDDKNEGGKGVMEFAIMRNNIYSLAVESVNGFGYASTNLEEAANDETLSDFSVYLTMKAKILPWIVRFNNITF